MMILLITLLVIVLVEGIRYLIKIKKDEVPKNSRKLYIMIVFIDFFIVVLVSILFYFSYKAISRNSFITISRYIVPALIIIRLIIQVSLRAKEK